MVILAESFTVRLPYFSDCSGSFDEAHDRRSRAGRVLELLKVIVESVRPNSA